jgi:hypothetical protein
MFECSLSQFSDPQPLALRSPQLVIARLTGVMEEGSVEGSKKETFISVLANNYPQTLGSFLMLRPPAFLLTVWKAVRMVMDPQTAKAYHFVRSQSQIDSTLDELFEPEVGDWIRREVLSVSSKPPKPSEADVCGRCFRGPDFWTPHNDGAHDPRGSPEYVKRFCCPLEERAAEDRPHLLHPNMQQFVEEGHVPVAADAEGNLVSSRVSSTAVDPPNEESDAEIADAESKLLEDILKRQVMRTADEDEEEEIFYDDDDDDDEDEDEEDDDEDYDDEDRVDAKGSADGRTVGGKPRSRFGNRKSANLTRVTIPPRDFHEESVKIDGLATKCISWAFQV